jgi:hypothetical protein
MENNSPARQIDTIIAAQEDWKAELLAQLRALIQHADPRLVEEVKWKTPSRPRGLPIWSHNGIVCMAEIWKDNVKLIFPKGVQLNDSFRLFNARLKSRTDRAIEFHEGDSIDKAELKRLVIKATELNAANHF